MKNQVRKVLFVIVISIFSLSIFTNAYGGTITVKGDTEVRLKGFLGYEGGYSTKATPYFYKSNTSMRAKNDKTNFSSRAQARLSFLFNNSQAHTAGNITMNSWPNNFNLFLAYIKQQFGNGYYVVFGKDWSLVNQRLFRLSSFTFKPYAAGFQGSKRPPQVQIGYKDDFGDYTLNMSAAGEYRDAEHGIVIGKNISPSGSVFSDSNIISERKTIPAIVGQVKLNFKTGFGRPSLLMAYYEIQPAYLGCDSGEHKETSYLYSFASKINMHGFSIIGQYLHTVGFSGIAGIKGNSLKTYSYIYKNNKIIKRKSDAFGFEAVSPFIGKRLKVILGYVYLNFTNDAESDDYFLKNEVRRVKTAYIMSVINVTKLTKLFMEWDNIRTRYASDNKFNGNFNETTGNQFWVGYRYYF